MNSSSLRNTFRNRIHFACKWSAIVAATALLVACGKPETKDTSAPAAAEPAEATAAAPAAESPKSIADILNSKTTLNEALSLTKPGMTDSSDGSLSIGGQQLAFWGIEHMKWSEIQALESTKHAVVQKDPDAVRGKKICTSGSVIEITADKTAGKPVYVGGMFDGAGNLYRFLAVGSSGDIVANSRAKFCGVVVGAVSYPNSMGGVAHGVQLVGMFDLPENKK